MDRLEISLVSEKPPGRRVDVTRFPFVIGSANTSDLCLKYGHISAEHACISRLENELYAWDLNSLNGTFILRDSGKDPEPSIEPVPRLAGIDQLDSLDQTSGVMIKPGDRLAFASEIWVVEERTNNPSESVPSPAQQKERCAIDDETGSSKGAGNPWLGFEIIKGPEQGRLILLQKCPVVVGRSPSRADILFEESPSLSRAHAVLGRDSNHRPYVEDLKSRNGTFVNGKPIRQKCVLRHGDTIRFGKDIVVSVHANKSFRWRFWAGLLMVCLLSGFALWWNSTQSAPVKVTRDPGPSSPVIPDEWADQLALFSNIWPKVYIKQLSTIDSSTIGQLQMRQLIPLLSNVNNLVMSTNIINYAQASVETKNVLQGMSRQSYSFVDELILLIKTIDKDQIQRHLKTGNLKDLLQVQADEPSFLSFDIDGPDLNEILGKLEKMEEYMRSIPVSVDLLNQWIEARDTIDRQLNEKNPNHTAVISLVSSATKVQVASFLSSIENEVNSLSAEDKMVMLRVLQKEKIESEDIQRKIDGLEEELAPVFKDVILSGSNRRKGELFDLTSENDWTSDYHERLQSFGR